MLTFDLDEEVKDEILEKEKLTYTALIEVIINEENNLNLEDYINERIRGNNGITSKLSKLDKRFIVKSQNNRWKYDMLKLVKYIYYLQEDNNILLNLSRSSYRSVKMFDDYQIANENKIFENIENEIKEHINRENGNDEFTYTVDNTLCAFTNRFNMIAGGAVWFVKTSPIFISVYPAQSISEVTKRKIEEYTNSIEKFFDDYKKRADMPETKNNDSVFEIFYQIFKYNCYNGPNVTQVHIHEKILNILENGVRPITPRMKRKFYEFNKFGPIRTEKIPEFVREKADKIMGIICDADENKEKAKRSLTNEKNLKRIQAGIELAYKQLKTARKKKKI